MNFKILTHTLPYNLVYNKQNLPSWLCYLYTLMHSLQNYYKSNTIKVTTMSSFTIVISVGETQGQPGSPYKVSTETQKLSLNSTIHRPISIPSRRTPLGKTNLRGPSQWTKSEKFLLKHENKSQCTSPRPTSIPVDTSLW